MSTKLIDSNFDGVILNVEVNEMENFNGSVADDLSNDTEHCIEAEVLIDRLVTGDDETDLTEKLVRICRCCLSEQDELKPIFDPDDCIASMIMLLTSIELSSDDSLPSNICNECIEQLIKCINFKQQIETADMTLRHFVTEGYFQGMTLQKVDMEQLAKKLSESNEIDLKDVQEDNNPQMYDLASEQNNENYIDDPVMLPSNDNEMNLSNNEENMETIENNIESIEIEQTDANTDNTNNDENNIEETLLKVKRKYYACPTCDKIINNYQMYIRHLKTHLENKANISCNICNRSFKAREALDSHMRCHKQKTIESDSEDKFKCDDCEMYFTEEHDLFVHKSIHVSNGRYVCRKCDKEFPNCIKLKRHVRTHFMNKPYKCQECGRGFPEMGSLTRHFRSHTGEKREKKHVCKDCGKRYYDSHSLSVHIRTHTGERPWVCSNCGKGFIDSRLLNSHMKIHMDEKLYACDKCDKRFTHQSTLTTHIRTHTGEKPYACRICGKSFIQSSNLRLHMRVHSGVKPYKCTICLRGFASSSTLTAHKRTHHGEKPYICPECGKSFARFEFSAHMRTHKN